MRLSVLTTSGVAWLVIVLALALDVFGRWPKRPGFRWMGAGLLLLMSGQLVNSFAHDRHWPIGRLVVIDQLNLLLGIPGSACIIAGVANMIRSRPVTVARRAPQPDDRQPGA